ncbi:MAG: stage III sporulation protein AE [bacterium]|nr:stage III sporulation protein AE [bacterium]MCM1375995.1 stage III sporulation protein AE [Muribaculum sp.]
MEGLSIDAVWGEYGLDQLQQELAALFPESDISLHQILSQIMQGDVLGAVRDLLNAVLGDVTGMFASVRGVLLWLVMLGMISALMGHFMDIFDKHQIADISFYFMYLLLTAVLLASFGQAAQVASAAMENILLFIRLLVPTYLMAVGAASGITTARAGYQMVLLLIYGVEQVLVRGLLPFVYSYVLLAVVNGIWIEEKLSLLMELLEKGIRAALKAIIGIVTGISIFQSVITPVIDTVRASALQKMVSAIPGIGGAADSMVSLVIGSAVVIKNSIGVVLLILLVAMCLAPLLQILLTACCLKLAAAVMGIISDKRVTACTNKVGEASIMLFKITGTALLLFLICLSLVAISTNHGL